MPQDDLVIQEEQDSETGFLEHDEEPADELRNSSESLDSGWETDLEIEGKVTWSNELAYGPYQAARGFYQYEAMFLKMFIISEPTKTFDPTGRRLYLAACASIGVTPASYFLRHIEDKDMILRHHGLGAKGAKAIAIALVVRS